MITLKSRAGQNQECSVFILLSFFLYRFIPDLEDIVSFEELTNEADLSSETKEAARCFFHFVLIPL